MTLFFFKSPPLLKTLTHIKASKLPIGRSRRELHLGRREEKVVMGNMSALFAALGSIVHHGKDEHKKLKMICPPYFLEQVDKRHLGNSWGQSPLGLPKIARDLHYQSYPAQRSQNRILTWGQIQELRDETRDFITNVYGIPMYHGIPSVRKNLSGTLTVSVDGVEQFETQADTLFYEKFYGYGLLGSKAHSTHDNLSIIDKFFIKNTALDLYNFTEAQMASSDTIVILGNGESAVWIARDFPKHKIVVIAPSGEKLAANPMYETSVLERIIIINKDINGNLGEQYLLGKYGEYITIHDRRTSEEYVGIPVDATGQYPIFPAEGLVPVAQRLKPDISLVVMPRAIPLGSLYSSFSTWMHATDNLDNTFLDPQIFHKEAFPRVMLQHAKEIGIELNSEFFGSMELYYHRQEQPQTDEEMFRVFEDIYMQSVSSNLEDRKKFKTLLHQLDESRLDITRSIEKDITQQASRVIDDESPKPTFKP